MMIDLNLITLKIRSLRPGRSRKKKGRPPFATNKAMVATSSGDKMINTASAAVKPISRLKKDLRMSLWLLKPYFRN